MIRFQTRLIIILLGCTALNACKENSPTDSEKNHENNKQKEKQNEVPYLPKPDCDDIDGLDWSAELPDNYEGFVKECQSWNDNKVARYAEYRMVEGEQHFLFRGWINENQLYEERTGVNNQLHGYWLRWHENGQLMDHRIFRNGELQDTSRAWNPNGELIAESIFASGVQHGMTKYWHENGQLSDELNFNNGELISQQSWDENGNEITIID